jgi:hypothetical protein
LNETIAEYFDALVDALSEISVALHRGADAQESYTRYMIERADRMEARSEQLDRLRAQQLETMGAQIEAAFRFPKN